MSLAEVTAVKDFGVLEPFSPRPRTTVAGEVWLQTGYTVPTPVTISSNRNGKVILRVANDSLSEIHVLFFDSDKIEECVDMLMDFNEQLSDQHGASLSSSRDKASLSSSLGRLANLSQVFFNIGSADSGLHLVVARTGDRYLLVFIIRKHGTIRQQSFLPQYPPPDGSSEGSGQWTKVVPGSDKTEFKRSLSAIHALLVRPMEGGAHAAAAVKLSATAVASRSDGQFDLGFNQPVGPDMGRAAAEVLRAMQVKRKELPSNYNVKFGFSDKWGGKDGPSAAVACALLLESLFDDFEIPDNLAVTGDMNADQTVQPVGGVADKIRGAMEANCTVIGIPSANREDIDDLAVEENLRRFLTAKIFMLKTLDEALDLANLGRRSEEATQALAAFDALQKEMTGKGAAVLYAPETTQKLEGILAAVPNLYSASILLAASKRQAPARYSLAGTLVRIDAAMSPFARVLSELREGTPVELFQFGRNNPLTEAKTRLLALKPKSDPKLTAVIDAQIQVVEQCHRFINSNAHKQSATVFNNYRAELKAAADRADAAWKQVRENRDIQDQLMTRGIRLGD